MKDIILYKTKDRGIELEVNLKDETVWLTQKQMAILFDKDTNTISEHVNNVYFEEELQRIPTNRKFREVRNEGGRQVSREIDLYNLDVIISVGYRVKSQRGTQFRIWATNVLRDYLVKGYKINEKS